MEKIMSGRKRILWSWLAVGIAAALLTIAAYLSCGCQRTLPSNTSNPSDGGVSETPITGNGTIVPFSSDDPQTGIRYWGKLHTYRSEFGRERADMRREDNDVVSQSINLYRLGYSDLPEANNVIIAHCEQEGATATYEMTTIAFRRSSDTTACALVTYFGDEDRWYVETNEVKFDQAPTDSGFVLISAPGERNTWLKTSPPRHRAKNNDLCLATAETAYDPGNPEGWDWKSWGKCVISRTAAGCIGAAIGCVFSGPAYGVCVVGICAGSALGAELSCAVDQFLGL
jgi:hypothetical protein